APKIVERSFSYLRMALKDSIEKNFPDVPPSFNELQANGRLGLALFSDTILIYTLDDSDTSVNTLMSTLGWLFFDTIGFPDTRLRCGVSYGEATLDATNSAYVGKALVEAHELQESQEWAGGALSPKAVKRLPSEAQTYLTLYKVPRKTQPPVETLAINWTIGLHNPGDLPGPWSINTGEPTTKDWFERPDVCRKWWNTVAFHDAVCRKCKPIQKTG
ncbi:MAG: hypothetical protein Q7R34_13900, partial [Dehalococcoidia bacterium]|nr:hypothetical protein [Dehalococcoidia bacterium]